MVSYSDLGFQWIMILKNEVDYLLVDSINDYCKVEAIIATNQLGTFICEAI
jgi:hypothetical protein